MKRQQETRLKKDILDYLYFIERFYPIYTVRTPTGVIETKKGHWIHMGRTGAPDLISCINGKYVGLEIKRPKKGKQQDDQKEAQQKIIKAGGDYHLIKSIDDITNLFDNHYHLPRKGGI